MRRCQKPYSVSGERYWDWQWELTKPGRAKWWLDGRDDEIWIIQMTSNGQLVYHKRKRPWATDGHCEMPDEIKELADVFEDATLVKWRQHGENV